jgi:probable F420-dependent oxidoreductase
MNFGVVFPQTEIGTDIYLIKEYIQEAEYLKYNHILAYDHILGANLDTRPEWTGPYNNKHMFFEPFILFSYMASITKNIEFATGIIILPQRQTALVAKQAATLDVLSEGRLRLGIGTGWNNIEYEALNENFSNRGVRSVEQIKLMKELWQNESLTFSGKWHKINNAGINPLPINKSIPIWFGGYHENVFKRVGELGDGWIGFFKTIKEGLQIINAIKSSAEINKRNSKDIGIEVPLSIQNNFNASDISKKITQLNKIGVTHISINTMNMGLKSNADHIKVIKDFKKIIDNL